MVQTTMEVLVQGGTLFTGEQSQGGQYSLVNNARGDIFTGGIYLLRQCKYRHQDAYFYMKIGTADAYFGGCLYSLNTGTLVRFSD